METPDDILHSVSKVQRRNTLRKMTHFSMKCALVFILFTQQNMLCRSLEIWQREFFFLFGVRISQVTKRRGMIHRPYLGRSVIWTAYLFEKAMFYYFFHHMFKKEMSFTGINCFDVLILEHITRSRENVTKARWSLGTKVKFLKTAQVVSRLSLESPNVFGIHI